MPELTGEDLIALRDSGFTQGPWEANYGHGPDFRATSVRGVSGEPIVLGTFHNKPDGPLSAAAPALLAYAIKADERVKALEGALNELLLEIPHLVAQAGGNSKHFIDSSTTTHRNTLHRRYAQARQALKGAE